MKPGEYQTIKRKTAWACYKDDDEHDKVNQGQFSLREHCIMNIKKCHSHSNNHRNNYNPDNETCYQKERTAEFGKDGKHQRHIASQTEDAWKGIGQLIEIHHLIKAMSEKHNAKEDSETENENGSTLLSAIRWEHKIVKHNH